MWASYLCSQCVIVPACQLQHAVKAATHSVSGAWERLTREQEGALTLRNTSLFSPPSTICHTWMWLRGNKQGQAQDDAWQICSQQSP